MAKHFKLTPEAVRQYLRDDGGHCPKCESDQIEAGATTTFDDVYTKDVVCNHCKYEWREVYGLRGIDPKDHKTGGYGETVWEDDLDLDEQTAGQMADRLRNTIRILTKKGPADDVLTEILDEMVYDVASKAGSNVNNEGTIDQIQYLVQHGVTESEIEDAIRQLGEEEDNEG